MAFIFTLLKAGVSPSGGFDTVCRFDDGVKPFEEHLSVVDKTDLIQKLRLRNEQSTGGTVALKELLAIVNTQIDISDPVIDLTPFQLFKLDVVKLKQLTNAIGLGVFSNGDKTYTDLVTKVTNDLAANPDWLNAF